MNKDFLGWHNLKERVNNDSPRLGYREREVWWMRIGHNVGFEEDGKGEQFNRPVLIVRGFSKQIFWGVPLSTTKIRGKYYYEFNLGSRVNVVLLSQLRVFDTKRLTGKIGVMSKHDFGAVRSKLIRLLI